jgi:3' terminal RNA ribose 2'-O-methyltransferase Hen1
MLLTITNTLPPATDLGFLLHKNPANLHHVSLPFGEAHVFYPEAAQDRCTAALLMTINPVELIRGRRDSAWTPRKLEDYVNDRPYVSSSFTAVALSRVFGTALAGRSKHRTELVEQELPLEAHLPVIQSKGGAEVLRRLFGPLGYQVEVHNLPLDEKFHEWGDSRYFDVTLKGRVTLHDLLSHLYVLLPVLDDEKHYYIGLDEVEKLLRHGEGWLNQHPERDFIVKRYLFSRPTLTRAAFEQLTSDDGENPEEKQNSAAEQEKSLEKPLTLHTERISTVAETLKTLGARRILDLGCGEGKLLRRLAKDRFFHELVGMDVSYRSLEIAKARLQLERLPERQRDRIKLMQGSLLYRDQRLSGFDAAAVVEVIEHLDASRLASFERVLFEFAAPAVAVITTPNREYNAKFPTLPEGKLRHGDHRFEWTRSEFETWARRVAAAYNYQVRFEPIGPLDEKVGAPSQMAVFTR